MRRLYIRIRYGVGVWGGRTIWDLLGMGMLMGMVMLGKLRVIVLFKQVILTIYKIIAASIYKPVYFQSN
jgi:hypothetical protein